MEKRICIIGAGPSGLTAIKTCLEENLIPVCYEKTKNFGGLWRYRNEDEEGVPSVMKSTIINSSKEMSAFSDFPPAPDLSNFMHNTSVVKYLEDYMKTFQLSPYISYNHSVIEVKCASDYDTSGKWVVKVQNQEEEVKEEIFDGVMICIGHHVYPHVPDFPGLNEFQGDKIHTHSYKVPNSFEDKNVLVIGIGNSGGDAAVELSRVAKHTYLSTRRGSWVMNRVGVNGYPLDITLLSRFMLEFKRYMPWTITNSVTEYMMNNRFDHSMYGLRPQHRIYEQHIMVNDDLPNRIASGTLSIKPDIDHFTDKGVVFKDDDIEYPIDSVLLATGYKIAFPFLSKDILPVTDNQVMLYKYMFPPHLKHPSLSVIGLIQPLGSILPISEIQCRWAARLLTGECNLPNVDTMVQDIEERKNYLKKRFVSSPRHTVQVDYIPYTDSIASKIGAKPNMTKIFFTDPRLFMTMYFGPCYPYQYRLNGPNKWAGATNAILTGRKRIVAPLKSARSATPDGESSFILIRILILILFFGQMFMIIFQLSVL